MAFQRWEYGDPCDVLERRQESLISLMSRDYERRQKRYKSTGENMFDNADSALRWSFTVASVPIFKLSSVNKMGCKSSPGTQNDLLIGLSQSDSLMQAQNIVGTTLDLHDKAYIEYIYARYSGVVDTKQTEVLMTRIFAALGTQSTRRRGIWKIVLSYFNRGISQSEIREALACDRNKVPGIINKVYAVMDFIHKHSMSELEEKLREKGIVR